MEQYVTKGTIVYNKVVAEGESANGPWYRSEVVIECVAPNSGKTYCKIFQYLADRRLPMSVGMSGEFTWYVDKKEWNGKTLSSCRITAYKADEVDQEPQQTAWRQAPQPTEQPQPQQPTQTEIPF